MINTPFLAGKIPATVITGFLGSGKTTMIRTLLENANDKRIALIINEFGDLGVDGGLLKGCGVENCRDDDVIELNNGCICCTVANDFIPAMTKLLARQERPDHIVIETSGLALPQPLVAAFNWPEIRTQVTVDGVVTVIDAPAVAEGRFADDYDRIDIQRREDDALDHESPLEDLFEDQIHAADLIVLNKADLLDEKALAAVQAEVAARNRRQTRMVVASYGNPGAGVLLGLGIGTEEDIENRSSYHELHHEGGEAHSHDDFDSFVVSPGPIRDPEAFAGQLKAVIAGHGILRLKGFVDVPEKKMRLVFQAVGPRVDYYFDRPWKRDEERITRLVAIGLHTMDQAAIADAVAKAV